MAHLFESLVPDWTSTKVKPVQDVAQRPFAGAAHAHAHAVAVGDAAHAFIPTIGMGASLAIEDAKRVAARVSVVPRNRENADAAPSKPLGFASILVRLALMLRPTTRIGYDSATTADRRLLKEHDVFLNRERDLEESLDRSYFRHPLFGRFGPA